MSYLRTLKRHTNELLTGLGESPDEVAATLRAAGVRGVPRDNRSCAVAVYVSALMGSEPRIRSVAVGHCALSITVVTQDQRPAGRLLVQLPKPVRRFVAAFDDHRYPSVAAALPPVGGGPAPAGPGIIGVGSGPSPASHSPAAPSPTHLSTPHP